MNIFLARKKAKFGEFVAAISGPYAKFAKRGTYSHEMHCIRSRNTGFTKYLCYACLKKAYIHNSQPWTPDPKFYILLLKPSLPLRRRLGIFLNFNHKYQIYCYFQALWWHSIPLRGCNPLKENNDAPGLGIKWAPLPKKLYFCTQDVVQHTQDRKLW